MTVLLPWKDAKCLLAAERIIVSTSERDGDLQCVLGLAKISFSLSFGS